MNQHTVHILFAIEKNRGSQEFHNFFDMTQEKM